MIYKIIRFTYPAAFFIIISLLLASASSAKLFISTDVVSGQITSITSDYIIDLDDGYTYYPNNEGMTTEVKEKQIISIRFYTDSKGKRKYIELAPGKNKLKEIPDPDPKAHLKKNKL